MVRRETIEFSEPQAAITLCCGGKKALVLQNERKEARTVGDMDGENDDESEVYVYDAMWVDLDETGSKSVVRAVRDACLKEIEEYDSSSEVNGFTLNGNVVWLDKATRVGLMNSTTIAKAAGMEKTTLWLGEVKIEVDCDKAIQLLSALEMYALECFNVTAQHKKAVSELESVEELLNYDYKAGYPERLKMVV